MKLDFSEFNIQDLKAWSLAAEKALKGKPLDGLKWTVDQEITLNPFYTLDDSPKEPVDINTSKKDNDWWIGEQFLGEDPNSTNDLLRKSLSEGLNSPCVLDTENFEVCLEKVRVDFLWPIFKGGSFSNYIAFLNQQELEKSKLGGAYILYQADFDGIDISGTIDEL